MFATLPQACLRLLVITSALCAAFADLDVEHSLDGSTYRPVGKLVGDLQTDTELEWQRPVLTADELELLKQTAKIDGLYSVRIKANGATLLSSVPAKCLLLPDFIEQAVLQASHDGFVEAFNYDVAHCSSALQPDGSTGEAEVGASGGGSGAAAGGVLDRPQRLRVQVALPASGPILSLPEVIGEFADVSVDSMDVGGVTLDPNAKPRGVPSGSAAGARKGQGPPPKDERTWLQKNWLVVVAIGMMVVNMMAKANAPPPQQGAGGGPAAGAGGGGRRG